MNPAIMFRAAAIWNLIGATAFLLYKGIGGRVLGLPLPVHPYYPVLIAIWLALFGASYWALATAWHGNRLLLWLAIAGKVAFFLLFVAFGILGDIPWRGAALTLVDVVFAVLFYHVLRQSAP